MGSTPCFNTLALNSWLNQQDKADRQAAQLAEQCDEQKARNFASMDAADISDELCCEAAVAAIQTRNAELIGRVVLHLIDGLAERSAERWVYDVPAKEADVYHTEAMAMVQEFKGAQQ